MLLNDVRTLLISVQLQLLLYEGCRRMYIVIHLSRYLVYQETPARYIKATFSFHKMTTKNPQMPTLYTN